MTPEELHNIFASERQFWWYQGMRGITDVLLASTGLKAGSKGLDAGCGTGFNALEFEQRHGVRMFGIDLAPLAVQYCRKKGFTRSLAASITALPFADAQFDLVTTFDVVSHLPAGEEGRALAEFSRVLRPDGWLLMRVPAFQALSSCHSRFVAEQQRFRARGLLQAASSLPLRVVRWTYANSFLSPIALVKFRVVEPLLRTQPHSGVETVPPGWLNRMLKRVLLCEAAMIRGGFRFAFGQSLYVLAQKTASSQNTEGDSRSGSGEPRT